MDNLIKSSLKSFDIQEKEYSKYIETTNVTFDRTNTIITFNESNKKFNYQVLGTFLPYNNVWLWSWMVPQNTSKEIIMTKRLLDYGLKQSYDNPNLIENDYDHQISYLKTQLVNSRFIIEKKFQLDIHLAICSFLLKENILFIHKKRRYLTKDTYLINYFLIYNE